MKTPAIALLLLATLGTAQATLNDLGNGLVADTGQNIYWLKNANLIDTACEATSGPDKALWDAFDPENNPGNMGFGPWGEPRDKHWICGHRGEVTPAEAEAWIQIMNQQAYLGYSNWRLPKTPQPDQTCETQTPSPPFPDQGEGHNCRGSELGYLFNVSLGNPNHGGTGSTGGAVGTGCGDNWPSGCLANSGPFINTYYFGDHTPYGYWSTPYEPDRGNYWGYSPGWGIQGFGSSLATSQIWPVSSPETQPVPLLMPLGLTMLSGLLALLGVLAARLGLFSGKGA